MIEYLTLGQFAVALLMGLAALCAFVWGAASGALGDVEAVKYRVLEAEGDGSTTRDATEA
jgi:cbb3-type cytochrome oxidase maturation protein